MTAQITRREGMALAAGAALAASLPLPATSAPIPAPAPRLVCPLAGVWLEDKRLNPPPYRLISGGTMMTGEITRRVALLIGWSEEEVGAAWGGPDHPGDFLASRDRFCTNLLTRMAERHDPAPALPAP